MIRLGSRVRTRFGEGRVTRLQPSVAWVLLDGALIATSYAYENLETLR